MRIGPLFKNTLWQLNSIMISGSKEVNALMLNIPVVVTEMIGHIAVMVDPQLCANQEWQDIFRSGGQPRTTTSTTTTGKTTSRQQFMPGREREREREREEWKQAGNVHRYIWLLPVACVASRHLGNVGRGGEGEREGRQEKKIALLELV